MPLFFLWKFDPFLPLPFAHPPILTSKIIDLDVKSYKLILFEDTKAKTAKIKMAMKSQLPTFVPLIP